MSNELKPYSVTIKAQLYLFTIGSKAFLVAKNEPDQTSETNR